MVHIGAAVASVVTYMDCSEWGQEFEELAACSHVGSASFSFCYTCSTIDLDLTMHISHHHCFTELSGLLLGAACWRLY